MLYYLPSVSGTIFILSGTLTVAFRSSLFVFTDSGGWNASSCNLSPKAIQICLVRVWKCSIEVRDQRIQIRLCIWHFLHLHIAVPYRLRHFTLAHVLSDDGVTSIDGGMYIGKNLLIVRFASTEARGSKQKKFFYFEAFWEALSTPYPPFPYPSKAHIDQFCVRFCRFRFAEIIT